MIVLKFGGSSIMNAEKIRNAASIIKNSADKGKIAVVSSALKGTTDLLIKCGENAEVGENYQQYYSEIIEKHNTTIENLFSDTDQKESIQSAINGNLEELGSILHGIKLVRECSTQSLDLIQSFGERMSCQIIASFLNSLNVPAVYYDSREMVHTDDQFGTAEVQFPDTYTSIAKTVDTSSGIPIITGFIGSTENGKTTTIGRNGSDYSASIVGAALGAEAIQIWTDVDGVYSADPRVVKNAFVIPELNIQEATELSYFGAEVIHPYTMIPAIEKNIPIYIKNTMNPDAPGTKIAKDATKTDHSITGIASINNVASINIEGSGMIGKPGIASKVFDAVGKAKVNVIMISQASSEHSICLICRESEVERAIDKLSDILEHEITTRQINNIESTGQLCIVAVIGENMKGTPGISGRLFNALGEEKINILAIAQGSSERNISFVIEQKDINHALSTIHDAFLVS